MSPAAAPAPRADVYEIERALRLFHADGDVVEVRAIGVQRGNRTHKIVSGYFDDPAAAAKAAAKLSGHASGVYFPLNQIDPALLARRANRVDVAGSGDTTADHDVCRRRWLLIDTDAKRPAKISASDDEVAGALAIRDHIAEALSARGWPEPVRAQSGNGGHLLYRIDLPRDDGGLVQRVLEALAAEFSTDAVKVDTTVYNAGRITKLYGTLACKGDPIPGRPHRLSRLERVPNELRAVPEGLLRATAEPEPGDRRREKTAPGNRHEFDLERWIEEFIPDAKGPTPWNGGQKWVIPGCPWNPDHDQGEAYIVQHASGAIAAGCQHESCSWTWRDLRERLDSGCYARSRGQHDTPRPPRDDTPADAEAPEPGTFAHVLQVALADVQQALGTSEAAQREPLFHNARDLFSEDFPATPWRVTGLISEGGITMIAAEPKSSKTWVATETGVAVSTGTPVFGEFYAATGIVAYFYAEDQGRQIRNRIRALLAARDLGPEALGDRLHVCPKGKYLDITRDEDLAWLVASCRALGRVDVLILDPLRDINSAAEDKSDEMSPVMRRLRLLGELLGCTVVVAHHAGKPSADSAKRRPGQRMRGSSAIYGATDSGIYLGIRGGNGTDRFEIDVDSEIKGGRSAGRFRLELHVEDDNEGAAVLARFAVNRGTKQSAKEAEAEADDAKMLDLVRTLGMRGVHCSKTALRNHDECAVPDRRARKALERLIDAGRLRILSGKVHLPEAPGSEAGSEP